jgi:hypothetical protein
MVDKVPILQHLLPSVCCGGIPLAAPAATSIVMSASSSRRRFAAAFCSFAAGGRPRFRQRSPMTRVTIQIVTLLCISYQICCRNITEIYNRKKYIATYGKVFFYYLLQRIALHSLDIPFDSNNKLITGYPKSSVPIPDPAK